VYSLSCHDFIHTVGVRPLGAGQPVQQSIRAGGLEIAADFVELLARVSPDFAGLAHIAEFRCRLWQAELPSCYLLLGGHDVLLLGFGEAS